MPHDQSLLGIVILLAAAVVAVPLFRHLGLGSVLGYLVAGVVIGPHALGVINDVDAMAHVAEFGVVFLLFLIGIELKPSRLWVMRRQVFGLGAAQVAATAAALAGIAILLGLPALPAVLIGLALAMSSTAFGLQILTETGELNRPAGRAGFSILLFQDMAVVPLLAIIPLLGSSAESTSDPWTAVGITALALAGIVLAARYLMRPLFRLVASSRNPEVFNATALLAVLGTALLTHEVGLSMALGGFLAGLLLADSEFRHQVEADIMPFRGLLLGLFFMSVGMTIDLGRLVGEADQVVLLVLGLMAIKAAVLLGLGRWSGLNPRDSVRLALLLPQAGEFGFVLFGLARGNGVIDPGVLDLLMLVVSLSMALTPLLVAITPWLLGVLRLRRMNDLPIPGAPPPDGHDDLSDHVIITGFGRVGQTVAKMLTAANIPYIALDRDADRVVDLRRMGYPVYFGDSIRATVLRAAGIAHARLLVVTLDNPALVEKAVTAAQQSRPDLPIHARTHDRRHARTLIELGAAEAVPETLESSLQLGASTLRALGLEPDEVSDLTDSFRSDNYRKLDLILPPLGQRARPARPTPVPVRRAEDADT